MDISQIETSDSSIWSIGKPYFLKIKHQSPSLLLSILIDSAWTVIPTDYDNGLRTQVAQAA